MKPWLRKFSEWGKNRPAIVVLGARQAARTTGGIGQLLEHIRTGKVFRRHWKVFPPGEWLKLYRQNRRIGRMATRVQFPNGLINCTAEEMYFGFKVVMPALGRLSRGELLEVLRTINPAEWRQWVGAWRQWVSSQLQQQLGEEPQDVGANDDLCDSIEVQFFVRVWVPCLVIYGEYPARLLRMARAGNMDAMDALLRVDKTLISDPRIVAEIGQSSVQNRARFGRIKSAFSEQIPRLSDKHLRVKVMTAISVLYGGIGQNLTSTDLRELYDGVAQAESGGKRLIDCHLPATPAAMRKAIQRERAECQLLSGQVGQKS